MLSQEENELVTRVSRGTTMGEVLRSYWLPALLSEEIERDGPPLRVRVLGEDLVAFRDSEGQPGLLGAHCPHRGASLFFGRNEEQGLRCVYHGWKFDVAGRCLDMPNEPPDSNFRDKIHHTSYVCRERNGVVWTYLGGADPPELPSLEWNLVPEAQRHVTKRVQRSNWLQAVEGGIDPSHSGFLHAPLKGANPEEPLTDRERYLRLDKHPRFELLETPYGLRIGTCRNAGPEERYWTITHFLMPFYNVFNAGDGRPGSSSGGFAWVPMDDTTTMAWCLTWNPSRPLTTDEFNETRARQALGGGVHTRSDELLPPSSEPGGSWRPASNNANDYLLDREAQRATRFSAVPGISGQDVSVQESMGPVADRTVEHVGSSDAAVIQARRCWLSAARELHEQGKAPLGVRAPGSYRVRAATVVLTAGEDWTAAAAEWLSAREPV